MRRVAWLAGLLLCLLLPAGRALGNPPIITAHPQNVTVKQGSNATFAVTATSALAYQWLFNGTNPIASANQSILTLSNAQPVQAGLYSVMVSNAAGTALSQEALLTVLVLPEVVDPVTPRDVRAAAGSDVTFRIMTSGTLPMGYRWTRGSATLTNLVLNSHTSVFTMTDVQPGNSNIFVVLTNAASVNPVVRRTNAYLTVIYPVSAQGATLVSEGCVPGNGAIDPGERVTVNLALVNTNGPGTSNLVATLLESGGIRSPSGPQTYSELALGGPPVSRPFTFTADGPCGGTNVATLRLFDGTNDLGRVSFSFRLGPTNGGCCLESGATDLALAVTDAPDPASVGTNLVYSLSVTNRGPASASGVAVTNLLPPGVAFISATASQGSCTYSGGVVVCNLGLLANAAAVTLTVTVQPTLAGGTLVNNPTVSAQTFDFNSLNNTATALTTVRLPALSINDVTVNEGDAGTTDAVFNVRLSLPSRQEVTVNYATINGTATAGIDYVGTSGTVTFAPGETNQVITIRIISDTLVEVSERFFINLNSPVNTILADGQGAGVIDNSDDCPLLVCAGAVWKYLDNGSDQGTAWRELNFDDSAWARGPAPLGYDQSNLLSQATIVSFGPDPNNKYVTTYFRHAFDAPDAASITNLAASLIRDDGGVVYLNGMEIFRSGMPGGPIAYHSWAALVVDLDAEFSFFDKAISPGLLRTGANILAVEIHQNNGSSTDINFDLELVGNSPKGNLPPIVNLISPVHNTLFTAPASVPLAATASDPDGAIGRLEFFAGATLIGTVTNSPYSLTWSNVPPGYHSVSARAIDKAGATSVLTAVGISVSTLVITGFTPVSGPPGTVVTINGANFGPQPSNNIVFFGGVRAEVTTAASNALTAIAPLGATYAPLTVTANGLTASARLPFVQTFDSSLALDRFSFAPGFPLANGFQPISVVIHDLDGDGWPDIATANQRDNTLSVYRNLGATNNLSPVSFAAKVSFATGLSPSDLRIGDLDADGRPDMVVPNTNATTISVFRNTSTPGSITNASFAPRIDLQIGANPLSAAIGDIDGDGRPDLAVANWSSATISVFRNLGVGGISTNSFAARVDFLPSSPSYGLAMSDFDGDGKADLHILDPVFRNTSTPGLIAANSLSNYVAVELPFTRWVVAGDLDLDGVPDFATGSWSQGPRGLLLRVLRNASRPGGFSEDSFEALVEIPPMTHNPVAPVIGDLDGDGRPEIVAANPGVNTIAIVRNQSVPGRLTAASFATTFYLPVGTYPNGVAIGDLDGDGRPDVVAANRNSDNLTVFRNVSPFGNAFVTSTNLDAISLPGSGAAATYPSTLQVSGFSGLARKVRVTLVNLNHTRPDDLDVLLVGPKGQAVLLMSDAGGVSDLSNVTLAFDDGSASALPDAARIASGLHRPGDYESPDGFHDPAPAGPYGTNLSVFDGTDPNGTWSLYVANDAGGSFGSIAGGWQLAILPQPPGLSISDARVVEGNAGSNNMVFTVRLPSPGTNTVSVDYATADDNAAAGSDYVARSGRVIFPAGSTNQTITNFVKGDLVWESNERFFVNLSNPINAPISDAQGLGTIQDDDPPSAASMPFVEDFESGVSLSQPYWLVSGTRQPLVEITPFHGPHGGLLHARMDIDLPSLTGRTELTLGINLAGWTNVLLRFWARRFIDRPEGPPPSPFLDGADFDGVAISMDGTVWYEAHGLRDLTTSYQEFFVPLDDVVAANGLAYNSGFRIRFNRNGVNNSTDAAVDGIAIDDIAITGVRSGELNQFAWSSVPSPQPVDQPIPVTITALDGGGNPVSAFTGTVQLSAVTPGGGDSETVVGEPPETIFNNDGTFTFGFAFTPNADLFVTHLRHYSGNTASLWTGKGVLLAGGEVTSTGNSWTETPLSAPVLLLAGNRYVVGFHSAGETYHGTSLMPTNFAHGTIEPGQFFTAGQDAFPTIIDAAQRYFVDLRYTVDAQPVQITPTTTTSFISGGWAGNITVHEPKENIFLLADDGAGHRGAANRISVVAPDDLSVAMFVSPNPVTITSNLNFALTVSNGGPATASGVVLNDPLPAGLSFVSANPSQGSCGHAAGLVTCQLGTLAGGATATIAVIARAEAAGVVTNVATVARNEPESYLPNNVVRGVTSILFPALSIDDVSVTEGQAGMVEAVFSVKLATAGAQAITVDFATADGTATGADYIASNGTLTFPPGVMTRTFSIAILGDTLDEPNETFRVRLTNAVSALIVDSEGIGTIRDDEPPSNDHFIYRTALSGTNAAGSNADATKETNEPNHAGNVGGRSVWWSWTAPTTGFATITTAASDFNTTLAVYTGAFLSGLALVAADDGSGGNQASQVTFAAAAGVTYQIAVDGVNGDAGNILLSVVLSPEPQFSPSERSRRDFWSVDGSINAVVVTNGVVYVGGRFNYASPNGRRVVAYNTYTAGEDPEFPEILSEGQQVILPDGQGGWFVGGRFNAAGAAGHTNLVHILNNNSMDPNFRPNPDNVVSALGLSGDVLYVGGDFTRIGGVPRQRLAAIHLPTGTVLPWAPQANGPVMDLAVSGNIIYVAGSFTRVGGQPRNALAALDLNMGEPTDWIPNPTPQSADRALVRTLAVQDNRVFVGGDFDFIGGTRRLGLAALDSTTGQAIGDWYPDAQGQVYAIKVVCDTVFVGGTFGNIGGLPRSRIAALDIKDAHPTPWNPDIEPLYSENNLSTDVRSLAVVGNTLYVGGHFRKIGGQERTDLAAVDIATGQVLAWNPSPNGGVLALAAAGNKLLAGFESTPGGAERRNLAAFDALTGQVTEWNPGADDTVWALAASGNNIYAGGEFLTVGGLPRTMLAAIDGTGQTTGWNPSPNIGFSVFGLATSGNTLYAAGIFSMMDGYARNHLAAIDLSSGQALTDWNPDPNSAVYALAAVGSTIYAGGAFTTVDDLPRNRLAAIDAVTGQPGNWNPEASATVQAITGTGETIYVGGDFTSMGEQTRYRLAAIDVEFGQPVPWNSGANSPVRTLLVSGGTLYAGGDFDLVNGVQRQGFAAFDTSNGALLDWNPASSSISNSCPALALAENTLYAGGVFSLRSSPGQFRLAAFPGAGAPEITLPPAHPKVPQGASQTLSVATTGQQPFSYQWRFNGTNILNATNASLILSNAQAGDSGTYLVIVANALGAITAEARLTVLVPVAITQQPLSQTVSPGTTVTLSVGASGNPLPAYQWRLNGVNIPGAVFPTYTIPNAQPRDGGSYDVIVANGFSALRSAIASVVISRPALPFATNFASLLAITGTSGVGSGSNVGAGKETGETNHVGKIGGTSVWLSWTAPSNGIAIFNTRGSGFDTLLAVYTGTEVGALAEVAADEDRGGFATSQAAFNAEAGTEYIIVVDGFAGVSGNIVLSWSLDTSTSEFPKILIHPLSQSVFVGQEVTNLFVSAFSLTPLRYQWFKNCREIPGATNATLILSSVRFDDVGNYSVLVMNDSRQAAQSFEAFLEIGPVPDAFSHDKFEDLIAAAAGGGAGGFAPAAVGASGFVSVTAGTLGAQVLNNTGSSTQQGEPLACFVLSGSSRWFGLRPVDPGVLMIDTIGSTIDTVLSVYKGTNFLQLQPVDCDNDGAPGGIQSLVRFDGAANTPYSVAVDGVNNAQGFIYLNWQLGTTPDFVPAPTNRILRQGQTLRLTADVTNPTRDMRFQWRHNGLLLPGETNAVLERLLSGLAGVYSVVASNFAGMKTNTTTVTVAVPIPLSYELLPVGPTTRFRLRWPSGSSSVVQFSSNLVQWENVQTNTGPTPLLEYLDPTPAVRPQRFYRLEPWP